MSESSRGKTGSAPTTEMPFLEACRVIIANGYQPVSAKGYARLRAWCDQNGWPPTRWQPPAPIEFCPRCGQHRRVDSHWMTCSKCGLHLDDWERYDRAAEADLGTPVVPELIDGSDS